MKFGKPSTPLVNTVYKVVPVDPTKLILHKIPLMKKGATGLELVTPYYLAIEQLALCNLDKRTIGQR